MTLIHTIKHAFTSLKPNGPDATVVRPSDWNANHGITFETGGSTILGRGGSSQGPVQELILDGVFNVSGGIISITSLVPVGVIFDYAGGGSPSGWHLCDGSLLLRDDYVDLFAKIGENYGAGDGFSTFAVPDLRGRATFGRDAMGGTAANRITSANLTGSSDGSAADHNHLGFYGGEETHLLVTAELPSTPDVTTDPAGTHSHRIANTSTSGGSATATPDGHLAYKNTAGVPYELAEAGGSPTLLLTGDAADHTHTLSLVSGEDEPHQNLPPMMIVTKIIFTGVFT